MERRETSHRFAYGELIFTVNCDCGATVDLTNPWSSETCGCGKVWRLEATAVSESDDDENALPNELPGERWERS
jgi:hypothetical protein